MNGFFVDKYSRNGHQYFVGDDSMDDTKLNHNLFVGCHDGNYLLRNEKD